MASVQDTNERMTVTTPDGGKMSAYLALPPAGRGPGIVLLQEIFGVNGAMRAAADAFAAEGFAVLVPDLFWRLEPNIELGYTEDDRKKAFGFMQAFDAQQGVDDVGVALEFLKGLPQCSGKAAFLGFCLGGKIAVMAGAKHDADAVISFYGVGLDQNLSDFKAIASPLQFHVGEADAHVPAEVVAKVRDALTSKSDAEVFVYSGAAHAFFNGDRSDAHDPAAAKLAASRTVELLRGALG